MNNANKIIYQRKEISASKGFKLVNYLPDIGLQKIRDEIWKGLNASPKYISSKFFYDQRGSELFESITKLDEYYPTRTEKKILSAIGTELQINFSELSIIELGSGDCSKIRLLLRLAPENKLASIKYYPVDISQSAIKSAAKELAAEFPMIAINGIVADFVPHLSLMPETANRLFCFFGSTIGNLDRTEIKKFMKRLSMVMQTGDSLLLGMDMVKDPAILEKAYNDAQQVTAAFNKNILRVVNHLLNTNFDPAAFEHLAFYNAKEKRIEMHLKAKKEMAVACDFKSDKVFLKKDETIHTENSHKFNEKDIKTLGRWAGLQIQKIYMDENRWFSLVHYKKTANGNPASA